MQVQEVPVITLKELKAAIAHLEKEHQLAEDTKVFLNTGWDSVQEIAPDALKVAKIQAFTVEDPLSGEEFGGHSLLNKAEAMKAQGKIETAIIINNIY
ncbi:hypothetical protein [Enterococcus sp. LJL90]